jgi:hypothetical protein
MRRPADDKRARSREHGQLAHVAWIVERRP